MVDFKIRRGLSTTLFSEPGVVNPRLVIEEGCWYLCTDTAELFLGIQGTDKLTLKRINETGTNNNQPDSVNGIVKAEINANGELVLYYTDGSVSNLGKVVGDDGDPGKNGLTTAIKVGDVVYTQNDGTVELPEFVTKDYVDNKFDAIEVPEVPDKLSAFKNDVGYITEIPDIYTTQKYEVLPIEGMLVSYRDGEVRLNTQRVIPTHQTVGQTGNPNMFYATFNAFAPEGATGVIESDGTQTDSEPTTLKTDAFGRKYTTIWSAIANYNGTKWTKWGDSSTVEKYLGFYYTFKWFKGDTVIGIDKVRVILTNDGCHDDLVPDAVLKRINEKIAGYATEAFVNEAIAKAELGGDDVDLSYFATKEYVDEKLSDIKIPKNIILFGGDANPDDDI